MEIIANKIEKGRQFQEENVILKHEIDTLLYNSQLLKHKIQILEQVNNNNIEINQNSLVIIRKFEEENKQLKTQLQKTNQKQKNTLIIGGCIVVGVSIAAIVAIVAK